MHESCANPSSTSIPIAYILQHICSNYSKKELDIPEELVHKVCTISFRSEQAMKIVSFILKTPAFIEPTISYETGIKKRTIYNILSDLKPWIVKTDVKLQSPDPSKRGPYYHIFLRDGESILDCMDEARKAYLNIVKKPDPALERVGKKMCTDFMNEELKDRREITRREIQGYLRDRDIDGQPRLSMTRMIESFLRKSGVKVWA